MRRKRQSVADFGRFCALLKLQNDQPMKLHRYERTLLRDYFDGCVESLVMLPKKNGKTTLLAALILYHPARVPDAECFVAAAARDQAMLVYRYARGFLRRSGKQVKEKVWELDGHRYRILFGTREIQSVSDDGYCRVLASDADTADGVGPTLALVDELHRHKSGELYAVFRDGLEARNGQMITISTAGDAPDSPLGVLHGRARKMPGLERRENYRYVRQAKQFCMHEWALDDDADVEDMDLVKTVNPAPWHTVPKLRSRYDSPSTRPWQWKRLACGIWAFGEESAIGEEEWRLCADPAAAIPGGDHEDVYIGVDIGRRADCTAGIAVWRPSPQEPARVEVVGILEPPGDGTAIPEDDIWELFTDALEKWPQANFVMDPNLGGDIFAERLENEFPAARVAVFDQAPVALARMAGQLADAIAARRIIHPDDERLNRHVLGAATKEVGEKWRFAKPRRRKGTWIDGVVALAMAYSTLVAEPEHRELAVAFA